MVATYTNSGAIPSNGFHLSSTYREKSLNASLSGRGESFSSYRKTVLFLGHRLIPFLHHQTAFKSYIGYLKYLKNLNFLQAWILIGASLLSFIGVMTLVYRCQSRWYTIKSKAHSIWELFGWFTTFLLNIITGQGTNIKSD